ncbi:MAG: hypothetical protein ABUL47_04480 [Leifsonia sp.]
MARAENPEPDEESDDEALHWAGDEARGQSAPALATSGAADTDAGLDRDDAPRPHASAARLVGTGVFAGIFLAYTVGWIIAVQGTGYAGTVPLGEIMWQFGEYLAIIASALWFGATTMLTRESRSLVRFGWLALGVVLLVPWPIIWGFLA